MQLETASFHLPTRAWSRPLPSLDSERSLVLVFGAPSAMDQPELFAQIRAGYPRAVVLGCSGAGEIHGSEIRDESVSVAITRFDRTDRRAASVRVADAAQSRSAGAELARQLAAPDLRAVFVLSDGLGVNGSELVRGFNANLPADVVVTGGLAGDGTRFEKTWVLHGPELGAGLVAAVGFYGRHVRVGHGSKGGWDRFGPERTITRSEGNVLFELDGRPALALYKEYLGPKAAELPASGLLFPLALRETATDTKVLVRTLLAIDEAAQSMTFAGDLPTGSLVQLMKADFERLVHGAEGAAGMAKPQVAPDGSGAVLAVAVSCVGRRLVLGDRTEEEVEAIRDVLPKNTGVVGFYSYGELSPYATGGCDLHNQTMTLTTFCEAEDAAEERSDAATADRMVVAGSVWDDGRFTPPLPALDSARTLVLAFGAPDLIDDPRPFRALREAYPTAALLGCSGAGEIAGAEILDRGLSVAIARFAHTDLRTATVACPNAQGSFEAGRSLGQALAGPGLTAVFVLSEGLTVNGSELVRGLDAALGASVVVTGGLAGDGTRFQKTWVSHGVTVASGVVAAVGLYGDRVVVGHGSKGGWDAFGPVRTVTRAENNVLYELDGQPALGLYKQYLGAKAAELPSSGLLFPLALTLPGDDKVLVRTLLAVDEAAQSMTFAGDLPVGARAQLMKADFDRLVDGARGAASNAKGIAPPVDGSDTLAVAVSCVGRRLVLGDRTEDEIEAIRDVLPNGAVVCGFYSYGELSPFATGSCDLHNQTMTLTTFAESPRPLVRPDAAPMEVAALTWSAGQGWSAPFPTLDSPRTVVLAFGDPAIGDDPAPLRELAAAYPRSQVLGCSGAGEIVGHEVRDGVLSVTVARFAKTDLRSALCPVADASGSYEAGRTLGAELGQADLRAVFVLSDGLAVNGSELVRGLNDTLDPSVVVTGGLAGDGTRFQKTWVQHGGEVRSGIVGAIGFYGDHVVVRHGSKGGWDRFGPERRITRSEGNVLYALDDQPALTLYKQYLGAKAAELPASGLLFPLAMRSSATDDKVLVRTLLAVDEAAQSMTFAGDLPTGHLVQLMKADFDRLVGGATGAASMAQGLGPAVDSATLAVAVSCVGRRLVLGDRTDEEIEAIGAVLPKGAVVTGFYSYGELSPYATGRCDLHNQTMTLTTLAESAVAIPREAPAPATVAASARAPEPPAHEAEASVSAQGATVGRKGGMQAALFHYELGKKRWSLPRPPALDSTRTLVLAFGPSSLLDSPAPLQALARAFPSSQVLGCSTSGEIIGQEVMDDVLSVAVLRFEKTDLAAATVAVQSASDSYAAGRKLAKELDAPDLRAVFVLSEGLQVNGSDLVRGLNEVLGTDVPITGGLAGDGARFQRTWVAHGTTVKSGLVAAVGFYGDHVVVGHGSKGGWDKFGPERTVTRSIGNVVHEIDGRPALGLYKEYLGPKAAELPASGLLFPLAVRSHGSDDQVLVRTLLAVDEAQQTLTFAGDVPTGHLVQLMKADFDRLVGGASSAATMAKTLAPGVDSPTVAIAISCVGRRLVLGDRTEEEVEAVASILPKDALVAGFYSYGELSPYATGACSLHNQTMTLTTFGESPVALGRSARKPVSPPPSSRPSAVPLPAQPDRPAAAARSATEESASVVPNERSAGSIPRPLLARITVPRLGEQGRVPGPIEVQQRKVGPVGIVTLSGRVNEAFQGGVLGRSLVGDVVLDLSRVERITSFGVREWLALVKESEGRAQCLWLAQCSEPVVNQITMIRGFAGRAKVTSFFAPYTCRACGTAYAALLDAIHDAPRIEALTPPETRCPRCQAEGAFDDDPVSYFSLRGHLATEIPDAVGRALAALDPAGAAEALEKRVDGSVTRIRLNAALDQQIRWTKVLDGIEGQVEFDLSGAAHATPEGAASFEAGIRSLGREVSGIQVVGAPRMVLERLLGARALPAVDIRSVVVDAQCPTCSQPRAVRVDLVADREVIRTGGDPEVPCKRCGKPLNFDGSRTLLRMAVQGTSPPLGAAASTGTPTSLREPPPPSDSVAAGGLGGWRGGVAAFSALVALVVVLASLVCLGALGVVTFGSRPAPPVVAAAANPGVESGDSSTWSGGEVLPPSWTEVPVAVGADHVRVVGYGGPSASEAEALAAAREQAIARLVEQMRADLPPKVRDAVAARVRGTPTPADQAKIVERYLADQGSRATPERSEASMRVKDGAHEAYARYALERAVYDQVVADLGRTVDLAGMQVAPFFPSLVATVTSDADLWAVAVERGPAGRGGVLAGDLLRAVDGTGVHSLADLAPNGRSLWDAVAPGASFELVLEANGAERKVRVSRPKPIPTPALGVGH